MTDHEKENLREELLELEGMLLECREKAVEKSRFANT